MLHRLSMVVTRIIFIVGITVSWGIMGISHAGDISLEPVTIREGIESQMSLDWPLKNSNTVYSSPYFKEKQVLAKKSGIDLKDKMSKVGTAKFEINNGSFFMLFYNLATAPSCRREYLVQRLKITKSFYNKHGKEYKRTHEYLVEVFKTRDKRILRADEHYRSYNLNNTYRRATRVDAEIGCGFIKKKAEGRTWPFSRKRLYKLIQDYSVDRGCYDDVVFEFSRSYSFSFDFDVNGLNSVAWPPFLR